ncbi:transglutaminase domain-containing protein [Polaribacter cellanae]|uniref:Transglutaminase-like domain-containing protein n=1 Tax=Polaribacter cellanae TaxID=2818493 RepID=A0A975CLT4_9FLAO|nr:transglutaminase domain-containing protein [Polaribacter cellanae]QTE22296.1 hypothetical protein J3359_16040 [Polaribacter cellanae]
MKLFTAIIFLFISFQITAQISDFKEIDFKKADKTAKLFEGNNLNNLPLLTYNLTSKLKTDVEKFRAIYTWVSTNIKADYSSHKKVRRKRNKFKNDSVSLLKWNKNYSKKFFKNLLKHKKTMCTGYAYLLKTMANIANIECKIIDGYGRNASTNIGELSIPNHSWNAVKINNKWYLVDATWSSGYTDLNINNFVFDYNDGYFLTAPKLFIKNHYPLEQKWTLLPKNISTDNFINAPLIYGETYTYGIIPIAPLKMENKISKNNEFTLTYQLTKTINKKKIQLMVVRNSKGKIITPKTDLKEKTLTIKYQFDKKGFYDVHLMYQGKTLVTYVFDVKK